MEWISVKDRLPDYQEEVLCVTSGQVHFGFKSSLEQTSYQWILLDQTDRDGEHLDVYDVTHWMPLPPPPKD